MIDIASRKIANQKIVGFEYLRIICAVAVVAIHSLDTNSQLSSISSKFLKFPVPLFLMMSFFLLFKTIINRNKTSAYYFKKRCHRLLPPFIIWSIVYLIARLMSGTNISLSVRSILKYLLFGTSAVQLYYIPLILYFALLLIPIIKIMQKSSNIQNLMIIFVLVLGAAFLQLFALKLNFIYNPDLKLFVYYMGYNFVYALLGICFAYTFTKVDSLENKNFIINRYTPISLIVGFFLITYSIFNLSQNIYFFTNIGLFLFSYYADFLDRKLISSLSSISFGVYLSHHLFIEFLQAIEVKNNWNVNDANLTIANFVIGTVISFAFSFILYKNSRTKSLVC